jgi:hypothetical protein
MGPSPVSVRKPPRFRRKSWKASLIADDSEARTLQGFPGALGIPRSACHAEGRGFESLQPLRKRPAFAGLFGLGSRLVRLRPVGLKPDSPRADRRPFHRNPCVQAHSGPSEPKSFCGVCRRSGIRLLRPLPRLLLQRHDPADSARRRDTSGGRTSGQSGFSPKPGVNLGPLRGNPRRAMAPRAVSFSGRRRPTELRGPDKEDLVSRESHGGHRRGVSVSIGNQTFCPDLGWAAGRRPQQKPSEPPRECRVHAIATAPACVGRPK